MSQQSLEERVAALEREVAQLRGVLNGAPAKDWQSTVGMFSGDEISKRVDEAILKAREAERRKARRGGADKRKARSRQAKA